MPRAIRALLTPSPRPSAGLIACLAALALTAVPAAARTRVPAGMPADVPAAATRAAPSLPEPPGSAWPFPSSFPRTSGTGRLTGGAELWSDFVYDDYGASSPLGFTASTFSESSGLAPRQGDYAFPSGPAANNGADIFRAGVGLQGGYSYWRVDWVTLADPSVPIAEWTFDTDDNASTGASAWPAGAGIRSAGIERALLVSSRGAWLVDPLSGVRTDVRTLGGRLTVDPVSKSFVVAVPTSALPVSGSWRVRLAAGLANPAGDGFAAPYVDGGGATNQSPVAERVYNITFRSSAQEPPIYTDGSSDALIAAAQAALAATPVGASIGLDGLARDVTGNFWMEDDQADTLASGDVSKFSLLVDWSRLAERQSTPEPQPTGYSARWYVSRVDPPGAGQRTDDGPEGDFKPTLLEPVQPYAVYVPTGYRPGQRLPLTWILHSLEVNYNQYGAFDPQLIQQLCQDRDSICASTEGFGPAGWYYNEAEADFWAVWHALAGSFRLDPRRTVISGYSMGGWASYKLAFEHPDDFAAAMVLDGPLVCGVELVPGASGPAFSDPACSKDADMQALVANARWIPYVIDQTNGDELVPTPGVLAQAKTFDQLAQRYTLLIHSGGDHMAFAIEDRFADAVADLGRPARARDPGSFTYRWYPSLNSRTLGIGATGDYWVSALRARVRSYGTLATVIAGDGALPGRAVTALRSGPTPTSSPLPGTVQSLRWKLGRPPRPRRQMSLTLTDVSALTVDARRARLRTGTLTATTDGPTRLTLTHLRPGTRVLAHGRELARAGRHGTARVRLGRGRTVLRLLHGRLRARAADLP